MTEYFADKPELAASQCQQVAEHLLEGRPVIVTGKKNVLRPVYGPAEVRHMHIVVVGCGQVGALQFILDNACEASQNVQVNLVKLPWLVVNDAERAYLEAAGLTNGHAGIEANERFAGNQGIAAETRVHGGV